MPKVILRYVDRTDRLKANVRWCVGDIWQCHVRCTTAKSAQMAIVIPTNGTVSRLSTAVMGAGLAKDAAERFPTLPRELAARILADGNRVHYFPQYHLFTFPTKYNWWEDADLSLIQESCKQLNQLMATHHVQRVFLPKVGCGHGQLAWDAVLRVLKRFLDSRCTLVTREKE